MNHISGCLRALWGLSATQFRDEKRTALDAWGKFVVSLIEGRPANVVPMRA